MAGEILTVDAAGFVKYAALTAAQIPASGVSAGTYGDATHVPQVAVSAAGLITAATSVAISGGGGASFTTGSSPPGSPANGDYWIFPADDTNGVYWMFQYDSAETTYKWRFVGGPPISATVNTDESTTTTNSWVNLTTNGPSVTPSRAGDYLCFGQATAYGIASNASYIGVANGDTSPGGNSALLTDSVIAAGVPGFYVRLNAIANTDTLKLRYFKTTGGTGHWTTRVLFVWPVRVI